MLYTREGKRLRIPAEEIRKIILKLPDGPSQCNDEEKIDFETLMSDPATGDIYLIQKNIFKPEASIYKVKETIPFDLVR